MRIQLLAILFLTPIFLLGQIKTQNSKDNVDITIYKLPHNVLPIGNVISYGPPNPKVQGRSYLIHFDAGKSYVVKTLVKLQSQKMIESISNVYMLENGTSVEIENKLEFEKNKLSESDKEIVSINGVLQGEERLDIVFESHRNNDLKNYYFLELLESKGLELKMDMAQKLKNK